MCRASVEPIPSSISVPKRPVKRRCTSAGRVSPAVTVARTEDRAVSGRPASTMAAQKPGRGEEERGPVAGEQLGGPGRGGRIGIDHGAGARR